MYIVSLSSVHMTVIEELLHDLNARRRGVVEQLDEIDRAIAALQGAAPRSTSPREVSRPTASGTTAELLLRLLGEHTDEGQRPRDLLAGLRTMGWNNTSDVPLNAVSVALRRLADRGAVVKTDDGYRLNLENDEPSATAEAKRAAILATTPAE